MTAAGNGAGVGNNPPDPVSCDTCPRSVFHEVSTVQNSNTSNSLSESFDNQKAMVEHERRKQLTQEEKRERIDPTRQQGADLEKMVKDFLQQQEAIQQEQQ